MKLDQFKKIFKNSQWSGVFSLGIGTIIGQSINLFINSAHIDQTNYFRGIGYITFIISMANLIILVKVIYCLLLLIVMMKRLIY